MKKTGSILYKIINFIIKATVYFLIVIHILLYGWYRYELHDVDLTPYQGKIESYKSNYYAALWVSKTHWSLTSKNIIEMKAIYPIYDLMTCLVGVDCVYFPKNINPSLKITNSLTNVHGYNQHDRLKKIVLQVWISHHLTFEEVATLYFDKAYYGRNYYGLKTASQGYFGKEPNALNRYQIIMLVALSEYPNIDPVRKPQKLMDKMTTMLFSLYRVFPVYYTKSAFIREMKSRVIVETVEESARFLKGLGK